MIYLRCQKRKSDLRKYIHVQRLISERRESLEVELLPKKRLLRKQSKKFGQNGKLKVAHVQGPGRSIVCTEKMMFQIVPDDLDIHTDLATVNMLILDRNKITLTFLRFSLGL